VIPGNDDAIRSCSLITSVIAAAVNSGRGEKSKTADKPESVELSVDIKEKSSAPEEKSDAPEEKSDAPDAPDAPEEKPDAPDVLDEEDTDSWEKI